MVWVEMVPSGDSGDGFILGLLQPLEASISWLVTTSFSSLLSSRDLLPLINIFMVTLGLLGYSRILSTSQGP